MAVELSTIVRQSKAQVSTNLNGEVALLNLKSALYYGLDGIGAYIWQILEKPRPAQELCNDVVEHFEVDRSKCEADVLELLTELEAAGLIEATPTAASAP